MGLARKIFAQTKSAYRSVFGGFTADWTTIHADNFSELLSSFKGKSDLHFLEIGCYEGKTSLSFANDYLCGENSKLVCIDPSPKGAFYTNCKSHLERGDIKIIEKRSFDGLVKLASEGCQFDFIYIDGSHLGKMF